MTVQSQPPPPTVPAVAAPPPGISTALRAMTTLFVKEMATKGRLAALGGLGALLIVVGSAARFGDDRLDAGASVLAELGLGIVAPIVTLVLASATLGQLRSDGTLVYVWLRPVPRWTVAVAAAIATLTVAAPVVVAPAIVAAIAADGSVALISSAIWAPIITIVGYTAVFIPLGASLKRSFIVGLIYVLIWGGLLARLGSGFAALSVQSYGVATIERITEVEFDGGNHSWAAVVIVPIVFMVVGMAIATWQLQRREVD